MISTSSIFSTGEKKWIPTKRSGRPDERARPEIGRVEVFEAKTQSGRTAASTRRMTSSFTFGSSNTASITRSQAASAP